jgi:hypothetical protein
MLIWEAQLPIVQPVLPDVADLEKVRSACAEIG